MMSGEMIYSDITFTRHQDQDAGAESEVSNGVAEREEGVTYSEVRRPGGRASEQEDPGKERDPGNSDPTPPVGSKATIPEGGSGRVPVVTLVCLCVLLLGLAITLGVLFQRELLSSELQDCKANLTRVKDLLATIQGNQKSCNTSQRCSPGWEFYNGSCYYFSNDKLTWEQSQYACIRDGGHLVIIESQLEQEFIIMKLVGATNFDNSPWIGLTDEKQEGVWVWMDNTSLDDSVQFWNPNTEANPTRPEPNDWSPGEDCARMGQTCSSQIQCWFDFACDQPCKRICESRAVCERPAATS